MNNPFDGWQIASGNAKRTVLRRPKVKTEDYSWAVADVKCGPKHKEEPKYEYRVSSYARDTFDGTWQLVHSDSKHFVWRRPK